MHEIQDDEDLGVVSTGETMEITELLHCIIIYLLLSILTLFTMLLKWEYLRFRLNKQTSGK